MLSFRRTVIKQLNYDRIALDDWFKSPVKSELKVTKIYSCLDLREEGDLEYGSVHKIAWYYLYATSIV